MNNELKIIVAGHACSGKSSVMIDLERMLLERGYIVNMQFEMPDVSGEEEYHFKLKHSKNLDETLAAIKANTKITLIEKQLKRDFQINDPKAKI